MKLQMFTNLVLVITSQYIQILNCYVVSLKLIYCGMSIIPQSKKKKKSSKCYRSVGSSLVAQKLKNLCAVSETPVWSLVEKIPCLPTPIFLPGEFHGQRSLMGYSPWEHKELDTTEQELWLNRISSWRNKTMKLQAVLFIVAFLKLLALMWKSSNHQWLDQF